MEDIVEEPITDIDGCDGKNPLAVVDYVEDLYAFYRKVEVNLVVLALDKRSKKIVERFFI